MQWPVFQLDCVVDFSLGKFASWPHALLSYHHEPTTYAFVSW